MVSVAVGGVNRLQILSRSYQHSVSVRFCSMVTNVSTRTASRCPETRVADIGDHLRSAAPGAKSLVTTRASVLTNTSQCSRLLISFLLMAAGEHSSATKWRCWRPCPDRRLGRGRVKRNRYAVSQPHCPAVETRDPAEEAQYRKRLSLRRRSAVYGARQLVPLRQ